MKLHELLQRRSTIATQMREMNDKAKDEKRAFSEEENSTWSGMTRELDDLDAKIEREEKLRSIDERDAGQHQQEQREEQQESSELRHEELIELFMRQGVEGMSREDISELRALNTGTGNQGGFTVPTDFRNRVVEAMAAYGGLANICTVLNTSTGQPMEWVTFEGATEEGEMLAENAEAGKADPSFSNVTLGAKKASSKIILISNELLQDNAVNVAALLARRIASRLGRTEAKQILQGDGSGNNVNGLINQISKSHSAAGATAVAYEDLIELKHAVDPAYRMGDARFLFNDATFKGLKLLKDGEGRPLWLPSIAGVAPSTIDGDQFTIDQGMDTAASGKASVAYGDFKSAILRRVNYLNLRRLLERYAEFDQVGFVGFHRFDIVLEDSSAIAKLTHA